MGDPPLPFDLDEARLAPPIVRSASVKKKAAITTLRASSTPFATIVAPAGYGKTTLLAHWGEDDPRPFAWVALDERDDDPLVFLRDVAAAIHRIEPIAPSVFDALSGQVDTIRTRVASVGNALAAINRPIVIALDDLHAVTSAACLNVLGTLIECVPSGSQIAVASREVSALPMARWRAAGMLLEIGPSDLRLDDHEADLLLRGASVALEASDVAELTEQTEGWPAGLYLAALSIRSGAPNLAHNKGFSGDDRYVSEYFRLEVLSRIPRREARFVLRTSVLDTLNGPLCDAVLETRGSARMLQSMERSNRFVVALDRRGELYRYHHLFRQLLRIELEREEPDIVGELNRRAMAWYAAKGQQEVAVRFGQAARETDAVARLVDEIALPIYYDGRIDTLDNLLGWFDDRDLVRYPAIAAYAGWVRALTGRAAEAERYLAIADIGTSVIPLADGSQTIKPWVAILRAAMMPDGVEAALADADLALAELAPASFWRPDATALHGIANALLGSIDLARGDLLSAFEQARGAGAVDDQIVALAELSLLEAGQGAWLEAARYAERARAIVEDAHLDQYALATIAHVAVARVAIHEHRHADARKAMTRAHRLRSLLDHGLPWLTVQVGIELTRAHLALGESDAARTVLDDICLVQKRRPGLGSLVEETRRLGERLAATSGPGSWAVNLTAAELRLMPYLATHLTYPEIAGRLFITSHTVRSEAKAIYQKLDASSRSEAVDRAVEVGLLEPMFAHRSLAVSERAGTDAARS